MTEISTEEATEIAWANSDQGRAAVRAAWDKTKSLGLGTRPVDRADIGAVVYAAYLAAGWDGEKAEPTEDDEPIPAHLHTWAILAAQEAPVTGIVFGKPMPRTLVLATCTDCGEPASWTLAGAWTLEDLRR